MADSTPTPPPSNAANTVAAGSSSFKRTVWLYDWWLIVSKTDFHGKRLAVAGVSSRKDEAMRVFVSAPIVKRHDVFSLETADGIYVMISGFINKQRTLENGFAPEVFNCFLFGFPPNWESYALDCFREEVTAASDPGNDVPDNVATIRPKVLSDGNAVSDNVSPIRPEILSDGNDVSDNVSPIRSEILSDGNAVPDNVSPIHPEILSDGNAVSDNVSPIHPEILSDGNGVSDNVSPIRPEILSDGNDVSENVSPIRSEILSDGNAVPDNVSPIHPEILSDDVGKPNSTSSISPYKTVGDHEKPFHKDESNVSKEMSGVSVSCGSAGKRRSARLLGIKVCKKRNQPASRGPLKHLDKEQNSTSVGLENCDGEGLKSYSRGCLRDESTAGTDVGTAVPDNLPAICLGRLFDAVGKPNRTSSISPDETLRDHEKPFHKDESNVSKEMSGVSVPYGSGGKRRSARLHSVKVCKKKDQPASGGKHLDKEKNSTSVALENCDGEGLKEPTAGANVGTAALDNLPPICPGRLFDDAEKSIPTSLVSPEEALGDCETPFPEDECNVLKEIGRVSVAYGSGGNRHSARLHNIEDEFNVSKEMDGVSGRNRRSARLHTVEVRQQKNRPASDGPPKHPDIEQSSPSVALENCSGDGMKSPVTPIQSQSKGLVNILSEQLVKKSTSRVSSSMSAETAGHDKKRRMSGITKAVSPKKKITKSVSAAKSPQERDLSHLNSRSKQKISCVSPDSLSLQKSKSGRLLLPPLEFWRNQIPVYNADREVTEIQEGASVVSPFRGSSPSLSRNCSNKKTKLDQQNHINAGDGSGDVSLKRKLGRPRKYPKPDLEESQCPT